MAGKVDEIRAERSGFSKETMGLSPTALANSNNPVAMMILSQSQILTKMIATIVANSGWKTMMEHIRELILKYEDQERIFDLTGTWMKTDPRRWEKERSSVPRVGVGFAGKHEELAALERIFALQEKFVTAQGGSLNGELTNSVGIYNTVKRFCRRMGIKDAKTYFQDPEEYQPPPPEPSLQEKTLQANIETVANQQKIDEARILRDINKDKQDHEVKMAELEQRERLALAELESKERIAEQELLYKYGKDAAQISATGIERAEAAADRRAEAERAKRAVTGNPETPEAPKAADKLKKAPKKKKEETDGEPE